MAQNEASLLIRIKQAGGEVLDKITGSISFLAERAAYVATALVGFGAAAVASFKSAEQANNELTQSMIQQGVYTKELKTAYDEMAKSLESSTTFADDAITSAQAQLQAYLGQTKITKELMMATLDLAAAKKLDLKTAAEMVGKAIGTETNALARQGIELDASASKSQKLSMVTEQLTSKFGGQAQAAAQGLGSFERLKNSLDNLMEGIGKELAPIIGMFTNQLIGLSENLQKNSSFLSAVRGVIDGVSMSFVVLKAGVVGAAEALGTGLAGALEASSLMLKGRFTEAKNVALMAMDELKNGAVERVTLMNEELAQIEEMRQQTAEMQRVQEEGHLIASAARRQEIKDRAASTEFTKEQQALAKMYGLRLKNKDDLAKLDQMVAADRDKFLSQIATMQSSSNKTMAAIGKAAAIAQITINTAQATMSGYNWGMAIGGPPLANLFAALAIAAGAAQTAKVSGVQLAEGGIVRATPGGIQATIGEGGRDEAVIPLDDPDAQSRLGGGGTTIIFNGPVMGDENQAMEFARAVDKSLLKLRQSNQSVAFEEDIF